MKNNQINSLVKKAFQIIDQITKLFIKEEIANIKKQMKKNNVPLPRPFKTDGNTHMYKGFVDGKRNHLNYSINIDPLESDPNGPLVTASYVITGEKKSYAYSSLAEIN